MEQQKQKCVATSAGSESTELSAQQIKAKKPEITKAWILSGRKRIDVKTRLLSKVAISELGCWEYNGPIDGSGYGKFKVNGRNLGAHKISYILHKGDYDQSMFEVMHACDNPKCINPDHLSHGTHAQNMSDMMSKGRMAKVRSIDKCKYKDIIFYQSARVTAIYNDDRVYFGSKCNKHDNEMRITSNGECVYCRRDYNNKRRSRNGVAIMNCIY